jgi:hypothetical protein
MQQVNVSQIGETTANPARFVGVFVGGEVNSVLYQMCPMTLAGLSRYSGIPARE